MSWHPERIEAELRRELARLGPAAAIGAIVERWPGTVGPGIAANAWPARLARDGTLHVATSSSAWAFELTQLAGEIERRLRDALGDAAPPAVRFAVGRIPERRPSIDTISKQRAPEVEPYDLAEGERIAAAIGDSELRTLVAKAAAASLARARHGTADR